MIDYALKKQVLENGCVSQTNKLNKANYLTWVYQTTGDMKACERAYKTLDHIDYKQYTDGEVKEANKVLHAHFERTIRLKDKITAYLHPGSRLLFGECVFLTLTFNNKTLANTSAATRRRYIARYLKQFSCNWVANVDYGGKNGREHYHALLLGKPLDYKGWHQYGAIKGEKVRLNDNDSPVKIAKYISKLTNHAIKDTAKGNRMLYSRNGIKIV